MDKCSCGHYEWHENTGEDLEDFGPSAWYHNWPCDGGDYNNNIFCFKCGDQLLPGGRVIQRETVPNRLMSMLKDVQATCPESGLQEFALKYLNLIHDLQVKSGLDEHEMLEGTNIRPDFPYLLMNNPRELTLEFLIVLLNTATKKAQEAKQ